MNNTTNYYPRFAISRVTTVVISALVLHKINNSVLHVKTEKYNVLAAVGMYERYMLVLLRNIAKVICPYYFTVF